MFCLDMLYFKRKFILSVVLCLLTGYLIMSTSQHFVYAQSGPSYNLTSSYIVAPGDTLAAIAARHSVSIQDIATTNSIRNINNIRIGQVLIIPSTIRNRQASTSYEPNYIALPSESVPSESNNIVQNVQTVTSDVGHIELQSSHDELVGTISNGQNSQTSSVVSAVASSCASIPQPEERIHYVRPGDTLYGIGRIYGVSVTAVRQRNSLTTDRIRVGACIVVPAGTTVTPVPDRRRSSEQPPVTRTPTLSSTPSSFYLPTAPTVTVYTQG